MGYWCRLSTQILVLMHMDPVLGLQGHLDVLFLTFWGTAMFLSIMSTLICIPLYYKRALASPHFHQTFVIFLIFFYNHSSNRYDAIIIGLSSYCSFHQVDKLLKKTPQLRNCLYWISLWACLRDILFIDGLCGKGPAYCVWCYPWDGGPGSYISHEEQASSWLSSTASAWVPASKASARVPASTASAQVSAFLWWWSVTSVCRGQVIHRFLFGCLNQFWNIWDIVTCLDVMPSQL